MYESKLYNSETEALFDAILSLETKEDCYRFFEDICTIKELQEISQRFDVAKLLWEGNSYNNINQQTGASTATICRVKKCLMYGNSGYRLVLDRMANKEAQSK